MSNLITEARELCAAATPGQWKRHDTADYAEIHNGDTWGKALSPIALVGYSEDADFIARSRTLIPELCDALEKAQEQNKQLVHELIKLACESVEREKVLAKLEAEVMARLEEHHEAD